MSIDIAILNDEGLIPSTYIRHLYPIRYTGLSYQISQSESRNAKKIIDSAEVVLFQRSFSNKSRELFNYAIEEGHKVFYETDDNFFDLSTSSKFAWNKQKSDNVKYFMRNACKVITSTLSIAKYFEEKIHVDSIVLRNAALYPTEFQKTQWEIPHGAIINTDYFKGTRKSVRKFSRLIAPVLQSRDIRLSIFGDAGPLPKYLSGVPNVYFYPNLVAQPLDFYSLLLEKGINFGVVPLRNSVQHSYKSDIKYLDFGVRGLPIFFDNQTVYSDCIEEQTGYFIEGREWQSAIDKMMDLHYLKDLGGKAQQHIQKFRSMEDYAAQYRKVLIGV